MNYCTKGQWVVIFTTGQIGIVDSIIRRRVHNRDGRILVQCGAGGPFVSAAMGDCREATGAECQEAEGLR